MPILNVSQCQSGVVPRQIRVLSDDDYSTITAENYFLNTEKFGLPIVPGDFICCTYKDNAFVIFKTVFSGSNLSVTPYPNGNAEIISVVGNIPEFVDTTGGYQDSGIAANSIATTSKPTVSGNFVQYSSTNGTLSDTGIPVNTFPKWYTYSWAGGSSSNNFILTGVNTMTTRLMISPIFTTNPVFITGCSVTILNTITVTWSGNPGSVSFNIAVIF